MSASLIKAFAKRCETDRARLHIIQSNCEHRRVGHYNGNDTRPTHPRRICLDCGYEEVGSWWSSIHGWRRVNSDVEDTILTSKNVKIITFEELLKHRPPQAIDPRPDKSI